MKGFFTMAKSLMNFSSAKSQHLKITMRIANQQISTQFRMCSALSALRLTNIVGQFQATSLDESESTFNKYFEVVELDNEIQKVLSVSLKSRIQ